MTLPQNRATSDAPAAPARALSVHYDPLSYASYDDPYEVYRRLRDDAPVFHNARRGVYVVSRYADVSACLRNHEQMVNALGNDIDGTHDSYGKGNLISQDQPRHTSLRNAVRKSFGAREILAMETGIREQARELIGHLRRRGGGDFTRDVALPLVFGTSMRLLGLPASEGKYYEDHLWRAMARTVGRFGVPEDAAAANRESEQHLAELIAHRVEDIEAGAPSDTTDVIGQILRHVEKGQVERDELVGLAHLVLSASTDAPAALLSNCVAILDKYPALQAHLAQNPSKVTDFVEETLRFDSPAKNLSRQTTAEITIAGVTIPRDSRVMLLMASANRDERVFPDPDTFDLDRTFGPENKILSFGEGIHSCMGAPIARLTARIAVEELVGSGAEVRIVGTPERWVKQMVRGFSTLPIELMPMLEADVALPAVAHPGAPSASLPVPVGSDRTPATVPAREPEKDVRVVGKEVAAEGVVALTLSSLDGAALPRWEPGSHVDLVLTGAATRQYSLCGDRNADTWRLGILRDAHGSGGSLYVHDELRVGDVVRVRGPRNHFRLVKSARYLFLAGGIGITPILPMIEAAEAADADWELVYGGRNRGSMAFLDELAVHGDRVSVRPQDETGLLDLDELLSRPEPGTKVYCCGPEPLLNAVEDRCRAWPRGSLQIERFVAKPLTEPVLSTPIEVHLDRTDRTLTVPPERSILDVLGDAGVEVLSSCAEGTCGTCETRVIEGVPDHRDSVLDEEERGAGNCMMICVSRARTPRLVLDI